MINLYFTDDEMRDYLLKEGFQIKKIKTWKTYNTYHNQVESQDVELYVAFESDVDKFSDDSFSHKSDTVSKYLLKQVFTNVIKTKLLSL